VAFVAQPSNNLCRCLQDEAKEEFERELSFQSDQHTAKKAIGGGTKTLAERLSQSLRDPLRSKDYLGTVDKGEITIDCHHHSKIIRFKNRKGYLSKDAMGSLTELIQLSDTNWYEKFSILKGGEEGFCAGLLPAQGPHQIGLHADLDAKCLQYRLGWLIARSKRRRMAILDGPCLGAGATMALSHWSPDEAEAFKAQTLGANTQETTSEKSQQKDGKHLRIATGRLQLSFQNAHFLGAEKLSDISMEGLSNISMRRRPGGGVGLGDFSMEGLGDFSMDGVG